VGQTLRHVGQARQKDDVVPVIEIGLKDELVPVVAVQAVFHQGVQGRVTAARPISVRAGWLMGRPVLGMVRFKKSSHSALPGATSL